MPISSFSSEELSYEKVSLEETSGEVLLKERVIDYALNKSNIPLISQLGRSQHGFVNNLTRRKAWSSLLESQLQLSSSKTCEVADSKTINNNDYNDDSDDDNDNVVHEDENQVQLDVKRSFVSVRDVHVRDLLRQVLERVIISVLRKYPQLRYYQGFHDVVSVFVLVYLGDEILASGTDENLILKYDEEISLKKSVEIFTLLYLRDFMMDSLEFPIDQLNIILKIIKKKDIKFYNKLSLGQIEPFFAISSILTIFSHELSPIMDNTYNETLFGIFDLIISTQSMNVPLLIYSNILLGVKDQLLENFEMDIIHFDNKVDLVHAIIQKVILQSIDNDRMWKETMINTRKMNYDKSLISLNKSMLNKYSVLITTASGDAYYNHCYTEKEVMEILRKEIQLNEKRNIEKAQLKMKKSTNSPELGLINKTSMTLAVSLLIGAFAVIISLQRDNSYSTLFKNTGDSLNNIYEYYTVKLVNRSTYVWKQPLESILTYLKSNTTS
ncbi:hypothetical protein Kpol_1011p20 [Vanderwaltozyma polyspora DSM 70294]|uniref:Rab-GAP TBC domain-containing protein n=1 Tax=Vanderwaltozyma polyspora (strain ATCC 22028 / DSM 70294 / BCRC 21397 / CBS 2163 / NBRC 10782 / NRRL Y-8283 / UCD 57-17) TaxID=436907 RepID=A7TQX5_VANPO|nr:uncharacterized protein Kpol_1011p20 [Vanderwaltozyma polyspora DSM 70294]EDO15348.1 hypothetical protein Kpol_1011p20 [Vanderwaltozyma polyspora DSM 70294]